MSRILIHDIDWLVTVDPERRIFTRGSIAIENNRIVFVGKARDCPPSFTPDESIDGRDMLVLPGFIDTHVHNKQQRHGKCTTLDEDALLRECQARGVAIAARSGLGETTLLFRRFRIRSDPAPYRALHRCR